MKNLEFFKQLQDKMTTFALYNNYLVIFTVYPTPLPFALNGLGINDYIIIWNLDKSGTLKMTDFAKKNNIKPYQMSRIAQKLVNLGYIRRYKKEGNFKTLYLELTPKGKSLLDENIKEQTSRLKRNLKNVTDEEGIKKFYHYYELLQKTYQKLSATITSN